MAMTKGKTIYLRHDTKAYEQRTPLTPDGVKQLLDAGYRVVVERSPTRIYKDEEYEKTGCEMAECMAWKNLGADEDTLIVGLKELGKPEYHDELDLPQTHTYFAHVFKYQDGWEHTLRAFERGNGLLYDFEFLDNPEGNNIGAGMSWFAGYAGAIQALRAWCHLELNPTEKIAPVTPSSTAEFVESIKADIAKVGKSPKALVFGAKGRCGKGSVDAFKACGVDCLAWDFEETKKGGPFEECMDVDIVVNCIYLRGATPPFITNEVIDKAGKDRKLRVICDVSCDPNSVHNPLPLYSECTTWAEPTLRIREEPVLELISIDNLPSTLPREASDAFNKLLTPALLVWPEHKCWADSEAVFRENMKKLESVNKRRKTEADVEA